MDAAIGFIVGVAVTLLLYCLVRPVVEWGLRRWHRSNLPHGPEAWEMYINTRRGRVARAKALWEFESWKARHHVSEEKQSAPVRVHEDVRSSNGNPAGENAGGSGGSFRFEHPAEHRDNVSGGSAIGLSGRGGGASDCVPQSPSESHGPSEEPAEDTPNHVGTGVAPTPREGESFAEFLKRRGEELNL